MGRYVIRRLIQMIPVFFGTTLLLFLLMSVVGNPLNALTPAQKQNPAYIAYLNEQFNLDDPVIVQYFKYIWNVLHGDFGQTFGGQSVWDIVVQRFPVTVTLAVTAVVIEIVLGISIGIYAAIKKGKWFDNVLGSRADPDRHPAVRSRLRPAVGVRGQSWAGWLLRGSHRAGRPVTSSRRSS